MKRQSKRVAGSMSNQDLENADRISELPEALILRILCLLPMKVAIATSLLSKQWRYLWKLMPKLKFDYLDHKCQLGTFSSNACRTLLSHMAPVLQSLYLNVHLERCNAKDTGVLLGIALGLHVHELVLEVRSRKVYKFPRSLFEVNTLGTLRLRYNVHMDVPSLVCFKSLRNLHLHYVDYMDNNSVTNLLGGCPNLKTLTVHRYSKSSVKTFTISVPSLEKLSIYNSNGGQLDWGYVINAPSLKILKIKGICGLGFCLIENVMQLVEASIIDVSSISKENLLGSLTSVKRLSLRISPLKVTFPTGSIFDQLVYLELHAYKEAWWNLLILMLDRSPKLKTLKFINKWHCEKDYVDRGEWKQPENVPKCFWFLLETFIWKGYKWQREDEKQVAKYVLKNAISLKRAFFSSKRIKLKEKVEVVKDLKSVPLSCLSSVSRRCERAHDAPVKSNFLSVVALWDWVNNTNLLSTGEGDSSPNIKITSTARFLNVASCHHRFKDVLAIESMLLLAPLPPPPLPLQLIGGKHLAAGGGSKTQEMVMLPLSINWLRGRAPGLRGRSLSGLVSVSQRKVLVQAVG
ncbi:hypothetical protein YC2023_113077 [Brassica napus]